ncbi:hypothetical protein E1301_Tti004665 [Triplophysa tibetana]|uniref:Uncharacterized protein n=1 Tax=Triplophysa tibetana TaxID=1572043 RepID=A0A5A9N973_9TELE|nr:hypothetical protein E1301_Tti004665 [Triplophysa tibetana]
MEGTKSLTPKLVPARTEEKNQQRNMPVKIDMVLLMLGGLRGFRGTRHQVHFERPSRANQILLPVSKQRIMKNILTTLNFFDRLIMTSPSVQNYQQIQLFFDSSAEGVTVWQGSTVWSSQPLLEVTVIPSPVVIQSPSKWMPTYWGVGGYWQGSSLRIWDESYIAAGTP